MQRCCSHFKIKLLPLAAAQADLAVHNRGSEEDNAAGVLQRRDELVVHLDRAVLAVKPQSYQITDGPALQALGKRRVRNRLAVGPVAPAEAWLFQGARQHLVKLAMTWDGFGKRRDQILNERPPQALEVLCQAPLPPGWISRAA